MKLIVFSCFTFLLAGKETCQHVSSDYVLWRNNNKLSFSDFKCSPSAGSKFDAQTNIRLKLNYKIGKYLKSFSVYCLFSKNESWIKIKSPDLLEHEQGHFDIGEIYARKLRIELLKIQEHRVEVSYHILDSMYKKINNDLYERQTEYDEKTNHFLNTAQQEIWIRTIKEELMSLE